MYVDAIIRSVMNERIVVYDETVPVCVIFDLFGLGMCK